MLKLTNLTNRPRVVRFGVNHLNVPPMDTIEIPAQQEENANKAFASDLWKKLFDEKIFALNIENTNNIRETKEAEVTPPESLIKTESKRKASTKAPRLDGTMAL